MRSIAFTSMCEASHGASSARWPVSRLTAPPGTSLVASTSASSIAASGLVSDAIATTALPPTSAGAIRETRPSSGGSSGATIADDAGRLRHGEVEVRAGDRVRGAEHLRELVGEARVPDPAVDRALDLVRGRSRARRTRPCAPPSSRRSGRAPGRGCRRSRRPTSAARRARRRRRRARPCARPARRSGPAPRRCARTPSAGTRRR